MLDAALAVVDCAGSNFQNLKLNGGVEPFPRRATHMSKSIWHLHLSKVELDQKYSEVAGGPRNPSI
jgi:hypothetical protein